MAQIFTIDIPKPCSENWKNFKKNEKGGFCGQCQKEVIDFTNLSTPEKKVIFKNSSTKVCGKFNPEQLTAYTYHKPKNFNKMLFGAFFGLLSLVKSMGQAPVKFEKNTIPVFLDTNSIEEKKVLIPSSFNYITITGRILENNSNNALPGVNISLKNTILGTSTDIFGQFKLEVSKEILKIKPVLIISYIGFKTKEINLSLLINSKSNFQSLTELDINENVLVEDTTCLTGEVVIVRSSKNPLKWVARKTNKFFHTIFKD